MKNRKLSPSDPQQHRIPDLDIIDLEAQSPLDDARPGASGGSPEEASGREGGKKRCPAWLNIHTVLLAVAIAVGMLFPTAIFQLVRRARIKKAPEMPGQERSPLS